VKATELIVGGAAVATLKGAALAADGKDGRVEAKGSLAGAALFSGVMAASEHACKRLAERQP
jgi:hypothetical protein